MKTNELPMCHCQMGIVADSKPTEAVGKKTVKSLSSVGLSVLIAFFPKCPICLAAYLSMFGSIGLARSPIMGWLFPALLLILGIHLYLLFKKTSQKGYGPFLFSLVGALLIVSGRSIMPEAKFLLWGGMMFIFIGSLWNSFSFNRLKTSI